MKFRIAAVLLFISLSAGAADITGYDIALTPRSGSGGWAHYYTGAIAPSGVHGYLYTYSGGTGTMADGVIGTSVDESHYFAMGFDFDPEAPEITVYLDGWYEIDNIEIYGGNFSNGAPGNLYGMDISIGNSTESYLSEEFGSSFGHGPVNDRVTLSTAQASLATNQVTISKFLWDARVNATSVAEIMVHGTRVPNIDIDVIPGDSSNQVYPNKGGKVPVAILSASDFDALQVDPATVRFGPAEAAPEGAPVVSQVDGEHGDDIVLRFPMGDTGILCNDSEVTLQGETYSGETIQGVDSIDSTECETGGCHAY